MRTLGRLEEAAHRITKDLQEEKENAHDSRAVIHKRLDEQGRQIAKTKETIAIAGFVDAQIRDEVKSLRDTVNKSHEKVEPGRKIKLLGTGFGRLLLALGISVGAVTTWAGDSTAQLIRHWLRL